jgi:hypothetical protein
LIRTRLQIIFRPQSVGVCKFYIFNNSNQELDDREVLQTGTHTDFANLLYSTCATDKRIHPIITAEKQSSTMDFRHHRAYQYPIQITAASLSLIASTAIVIMIKIGKLSSPYRRIIFSIGAADVIQSMAMVAGPFSPPKGDRFAPWAVGNIQTCDVNGFLMSYGSTVVPLYLFILSLYYFCKLKLRMTDADFCNKIEIKAHFIINITMLIASFMALQTESYNSTPTGGICHFARSPMGCGTYPEIVGECVRGKYALLFVYIFTVGVVFLCFLGIVVLMVMLIGHAAHAERVYSLNLNQNGQPRTSSLRNCFRCVFCWFREREQAEDESDTDFVLRLYRRETVLQGSLYVGSFLITYAVTLVVIISSFFMSSIPEWVNTVTFATYPVMGLFNILIYTRPKVQKLRYICPELSWLKSFLLVIKAGGEVPDEQQDPHALELSCCHRSAKPSDTTSPNEDLASSKSWFYSYSSVFRMRSD